MGGVGGTGRHCCMERGETKVWEKKVTISSYTFINWSMLRRGFLCTMILLSFPFFTAISDVLTVV